MSEAPIDKQYLRPSVYAPGGQQFIPPAETHRDPSPEEIAAAHRANRVSRDELIAAFGEEAFVWLKDKNLLGTKSTSYSHRLRWSGGVNVTVIDWYQKDVVERGVQELRAMAKAVARWR